MKSHAVLFAMPTTGSVVERERERVVSLKQRVETTREEGFCKRGMLNALILILLNYLNGGILI